MQINFDVLVIGSGPAGCAAATFVARCRWKTLAIDKAVDQGYLGSLGTVGYFPGFPEGISGGDLVGKMRRQAELAGVQLVTDSVTALAADSKPFRILTDGGKEFEAQAVVIATGAAARTNYLSGEREFLGRGVYHDAQAYGPAVAKGTAAVIGKTRLAATEALLLTRFAERVHLIIPSNKLDAEEAVMNKLRASRNIEMHFSTSLKRIAGEDHVNSITVFTGGQEKEIGVAGVFPYVHDYSPTTAFVGRTLDLAADGSVKVDRELATSVEGIFACGDVLCSRPQFPAVAAAQGLLAGIGVDKYLSSR